MCSPPIPPLEWCPQIFHCRDRDRDDSNICPPWYPLIPGAGENRSQQNVEDAIEVVVQQPDSPTHGFNQVFLTCGRSITPERDT